MDIVRIDTKENGYIVKYWIENNTNTVIQQIVLENRSTFINFNLEIADRTNTIALLKVTKFK